VRRGSRNLPGCMPSSVYRLLVRRKADASPAHRASRTPSNCEPTSGDWTEGLSRKLTPVLSRYAELRAAGWAKPDLSPAHALQSRRPPPGSRCSCIAADGQVPFGPARPVSDMTFLMTGRGGGRSSGYLAGSRSPDRTMSPAQPGSTLSGRGPSGYISLAAVRTPGRSRLDRPAWKPAGRARRFFGVGPRPRG